MTREPLFGACEHDRVQGKAAAAADLGWLKEVFAPQARGTFHWDIVSGRHSWNDEFQALYGWGGRERTPHPDHWFGSVHPQDRGDLEGDVARAAGAGEAFERTFRVSPGHGPVRWMHAKCLLERDDVGALQRLVIVNADITHLKSAEQALQCCESRLMQNCVGRLVGAFVAEPASGQIWLSPTLAQDLGVAKSQLSFSEFCAHFDPQSIRELQARLSETNDGDGEGEFRHEVCALGPDRRLRWLYVSGETLCQHRTGGDTQSYHVALVADITDQKALEKALAEREATQRSILDTGPDAIIVIDDRGIIRAFNTVAQRQFGYSAEEAVGRDVSTLMTAEHAHGHRGYVQRYVTTGRAAIIGSSREVEARRKDGSVFPAELFVGEIKTGDERSFVGFLRDLTDRRQAQAKLRAAQADLFHAGRVSAMGEIAAAIAHELNQPLSAATSFLNAARRYMERGGHEAQASDALSSAASEQVRAGQILQRLRRFLAKEEGERRPEPLAELLKEAVLLASIGARSGNPAVIWDLAPDIGDVLVDRIQIQQVVTNLIRNAREAMDGHAHTGAPTIWIGAQRLSPERVQVVIEDNGPGIDPAILARLFQPFESTKATGMGIGLRICKTIIENHNGRLAGENSERGGARFIFTLVAA